MGVVVTGEHAVPEVETRMDVEVCEESRRFCGGQAMTFQAGQQPDFFVELTHFDSEEPRRMSVIVHAGTDVLAGPEVLTVTPEWSEPNGPGCDPAIHDAHVEIDAVREAGRGGGGAGS